MADQAISIKEAARRLGVSEQTIRRMIQAGEIRSFRVLGQVRIRESEVERIMQGGSEEIDQDQEDD
jgi:excisionase family DNA binding protein